MIKLVYFARLREALGTAGEQIELPPGVATAGALREHLAARGGAWADELGAGRNIRVAVNQDLADAGARVASGDEVAFFPPVTGG